MIIGFDIDDTITRNVSFFSFLSKALIDAGHKVIIITHRDQRKITERDMKKWNIHYHELILSDINSMLNYGVNEWKAEICREKKIDVFFEDDPDVLKNIASEIFCLMPVDENLRNIKKNGSFYV